MLVTDPTTDFDILCNASLRQGPAELFRLAATDVNINARDALGMSFLHWLLSMAGSDDDLNTSDRMNLITTMLDLGADPHALDGDGNSLLLEAVLDQDTVMIELLLSRGVNPNCGCGERFETLYDFALFDYGFEAGVMWNKPAFMPSPEDRADGDAWLRYLDREAEASGRRRPDYLFVMR